MDVEFEKSDYMYGFITTNKYDKFFPNKILKDMRLTLMKIVSKYSDEYVAKKEDKSIFKKIISKNKKTDGNISTTIKNHFDDIVGIFSNYNFLIDY